MWRPGQDESIKVVVLEGSGKHFCAGADLPQFTKRMESDPRGTADLGRRAAEALAAIPRSRSQPSRVTASVVRWCFPLPVI